MFLESERWSLTKPSIFKKIEYINNMKTSSTLDKILNGKPKADLLGVLTSGEDMHRTFGDFLKELEERKATVYVEAFMTLTVAELVAAASGSGSKTSTPKTDVPAIENFKDETVRAAWKTRVLELLEGSGTPHAGMFESRGLSPAKIREAMGSGNESQGRELLGEMVAAGQIVSTGDTKGKKFVVARLAAQAEAVHKEEVAKAKAAAEKKAADKAAEAAKVATEAKPAATEAPKAKPAAKK